MDEALKEEKSLRDGSWSESIAVGNMSFIESTRTQLGLFSKDRFKEEYEGQTVLREEISPYSTHFDSKKGTLSPENSRFWEENAYESIG